METRIAKELLHIQHWLEVAALIVSEGKDDYDINEIAQEAGDSLMIKIGEAAKTLAARGFAAPAGVSWSDAAKNREKLVHHYSIDHRPRGDVADALQLSSRMGSGARATFRGGSRDARCRWHDRVMSW